MAVVTGAGSGIGRALAQELATAGAQLALADINGAGLEQTPALVRSATVHTYQVDVGNASAVDEFAAKVRRDFKRVSLRHESKSTGIRVSCVHPAGVQTPIADNARIGEQASPEGAAILRERFKKLAPTSPLTSGPDNRQGNPEKPAAHSRWE